ncbi:MAG: hypothetical protein A2173_07310 [Planctomycetes bacterium RBG_13_44_8b]|nr:MAG: hypothetical protein A2173_07310 [Planctomycetes bacterium RBG_13_44_8b]
MELVDKAKLMQYKALAEQHLSDPVKLRLFTVGALLLLVTVLVYMPLYKIIENNGRLLIAARERNNYIADCEKLRAQTAAFRPFIEGRRDTSDWISYLLDGMRQFQIRLREMSPKKQSQVGPYKAAALSMDIEGDYQELKNYVEWLEDSKTLVRIDTLQLAKGRNDMSMKITVLGIMSKK